MIYLNRAGFNGLYRVNGSGEFNVPIGNKKEISICRECIFQASADLASAQIECKDFAQIPKDSAGFYYLDPPYSGTFNGYTKDRFEDFDYHRLRDFCKDLNSIGAEFLLSSSDAPLVWDLFGTYSVHRVPARRAINRTDSVDLLIRNY